MFAVVQVLDVAQVRALVHSLHGALERAQEALAALQAKQPAGSYVIVEVRGAPQIGAVISHEAIAPIAPARAASA